jgi:osmoprotectant transport system substrate-binding protein
VKHRKLFALLSLFACLLGMSACGDEEDGGSDTGAGAAAIRPNPDNADTTIRVGSKNFTEQKVLGEIYAQGLEAAGFKVTRKLSLGNEHAAQDALERGEVDGYPEYTGTALLSLCGVDSADVPKDPDEAYEQARKCFVEKQMTAYPPTPFTSSNEVAVTEEVAEANDLQQISDLARVDQEFTLFGSPECEGRSDCLKGLQEVYGLTFKRFSPVSVDERHSVLDRGDKIASIVFTTDPQNRRSGIVLLEDDRGMYPPNNSTFVVRDEVASRAGGDLERVIRLLQDGLTDEVMQELNARVDIDQESPGAVARAYLQQARLIPGEPTT